MLFDSTQCIAVVLYGRDVFRLKKKKKRKEKKSHLSGRNVHCSQLNDNGCANGTKNNWTKRILQVANN